MAENTVKNVFLALMGAIVAVILYLIMFGWGNGDYRFLSTGVIKSDVNTGVGANVNKTQFDGVIFIAARNIEGSIARYYYEYCYLPNAHVNDGYDMALGYISGKDISYQTTPSNLVDRATTIVPNDKSNGSKREFILNTNTGGVPSYSIASSSLKASSTGWYGAVECIGDSELYNANMH